MIVSLDRALKRVTPKRLLPILFVLACFPAYSFSGNVISWILLVVLVISSVVLVVISMFVTNKKVLNIISPLVSSVMLFFLLIAALNYIIIFVPPIALTFTKERLYQELNYEEKMLSSFILVCYSIFTLVEILLFYRLIRNNNRVESIENTDVSDSDPSIMEEEDIELITIATQPTAEVQTTGMPTIEEEPTTGMPTIEDDSRSLANSSF